MAYTVDRKPSRSAAMLVPAPSCKPVPFVDRHPVLRVGADASSIKKRPRCVGDGDERLDPSHHVADECQLRQSSMRSVNSS
jgi:hypothetical protein